jgi:hypothetical protein
LEARHLRPLEDDLPVISASSSHSLVAPATACVPGHGEKAFVASNRNQKLKLRAASKRPLSIP